MKLLVTPSYWMVVYSTVEYRARFPPVGFAGGQLEPVPVVSDPLRIAAAVDTYVCAERGPSILQQ